MRLLAPTVAVSQAPIAEVLAALRTAGFAPAAEDSSGAIVDLQPRGARVPAPQHRRTFRALPKPSPDTLAAVVSMLRKVDSAPFANVRLDPAVAMALLQQAAMAHKDVVIGYVDAAGVATQRVVRPLRRARRPVDGLGPRPGRPREFAVHRVTSVMSADAG